MYRCRKSWTNCSRTSGLAAAIILTALVAVPRHAAAMPVIPDAAITAGGVSSVADLSEEARFLDAALVAGNSAEAEKRLAAVNNIKARLSARNLYFVSRALAARSAALGGAGKTAAAVAAARAATAASPDNAAAWLLLARQSFAADPAGFGGWSAPVGEVFKAYYRHPLFQRAFGHNLLAVMVFAAFTAFFLFLLAVFTAQRRAMVNDFARLMPVYMDAATSPVALALLLLAVLCAAGFFAALLVTGLLLAGYMKPRGKAVMALFIIFFAALPFFAARAGMGAALLESRDARAADRFITGGFEPDDINVFEAAYRRNNGDTRLMMILGAMNRRVQNYSAAETYLKKVIQLDPKNVPALIEMGNVNFNRQEFREAEIMYKNAMGLSPSLFEGHYNLGSVYLEQFRTEESNAELDAAGRIDPARAKQLLAARGDKYADKAISVIQKGEMPLYIEQEIGEKGADLAAKAAAFIAWNAAPGAHIALMAGYLVLFFAAAAAWGRSGVHETCNSCGDIFLPMFERPEKGVYKCNQCVAYSSPKKSAIFGLKEKKVAQILKYQEEKHRTAMALNLLAPGLGSVWRSIHPAGAFFLLISSAFIAMLYVLLFTALLGYRPAPVSVYAGLGGLMAVYYLLAVPFVVKGR